MHCQGKSYGGICRAQCEFFRRMWITFMNALASRRAEVFLIHSYGKHERQSIQQRARHDIRRGRRADVAEMAVMILEPLHYQCGRFAIRKRRYRSFRGESTTGADRDGLRDALDERHGFDSRMQAHPSEAKIILLSGTVDESIYTKRR